MKRVLTVFLGLTVLWISSVLPANAQPGVDIKIVGADSMYGRVHGLSQLYAKDHPGYHVTVAKNSLVDEGMQELLNGRADITMASRRATAQERVAAQAKGIDLVEHLIGYGGIVIITDSENPVGALTIEQAGKLLTGEIVNWKDLGGKDQPVVVLKVGEKHPGTTLFVEEDILRGGHIAQGALILPDFPSIMQKVSEASGSVAYTRLRDPFESEAGRSARIKALKIKKVEQSQPVAPSRASILDGSYPLKRPYYLYTTSKARKEVLSLVDFIVEKGWGEQNLTYLWQ